MLLVLPGQFPDLRTPLPRRVRVFLTPVRLRLPLLLRTVSDAGACPRCAYRKGAFDAIHPCRPKRSLPPRYSRRTLLLQALRSRYAVGHRVDRVAALTV